VIDKVPDEDPFDDVHRGTLGAKADYEEVTSEERPSTGQALLNALFPTSSGFVSFIYFVWPL